MGFIDVEELLSDLRSGKSLNDKIYYISFDSQKNSRNDLLELQGRCAKLGYSFNNVELYRSHKQDSPHYFYLVRNVPSSYSAIIFKQHQPIGSAVI